MKLYCVEVVFDDEDDANKFMKNTIETGMVVLGFVQDSIIMASVKATTMHILHIPNNKDKTNNG